VNQLTTWNDTIVALATPPGIGAIGVIRLSGKNALSIIDLLLPSKKISKAVTHTLHVGIIEDGEHKLDEVVVSLFKSPRSYTGEDVVEISCHGSSYIQQQIIEACIKKGARLALPGEFTQRAFLNGKLDLAQAEAVADLIAANSKAAQQTALYQLRGGFSQELKMMREELVNFAALIELELDFSDEDVEFADRTQLKNLVDRIYKKADSLSESFRLGNVIKNGVSVAIIGKPNAGKSTLLNAFLNEERAIVSDIAGTTRDTIEEMLNINGVLFRLIDTAGIREHSTDTIENMGIERSKQNATQADIILHIIDLLDEDEHHQFEWLKQYESKIVTVYNKFNAYSKKKQTAGKEITPKYISVDAKDGFGIDELKNIIYEKTVGETVNTEATVVTNARHFEALQNIKDSLLTVQSGLAEKLSGDLLTIDIRQALQHLGMITGQVDVDRDILGTIFSKFCIGK